jgi:hypothetical protein
MVGVTVRAICLIAVRCLVFGVRYLVVRGGVVLALAARAGRVSCPYGSGVWFGAALGRFPSTPTDWLSGTRAPLRCRPYGVWGIDMTG